MITATADELLTYVADMIDVIERYGATVLPPNHGPEVALTSRGKDLAFDLETRLPAGPRSRVDLTLAERWGGIGDGRFELATYGYELRHRQLGYRRALHRHDVGFFVRNHDVATHEHCESLLGYPDCDHYAGALLNGAIDGFLRLYNIWLGGTRPDCSELRCLR